MNLTIDPKALAERLRAAPACNAADAIPNNGISKYLLEHFLLPFFGENPPTVGSLDFDAFTLEEAGQLEDYLSKASKTSEELVRLFAFYDKATPIAESCRAYC